MSRVILITGGTAGIGLAAAEAFAAQGASVVLAARNEDKAKAVMVHLNRLSGAERASYIIGDLSRPQEVRKVAQTFKERHERLDVLFNNAGAIFVNRELTPDGLEKTFALNHLSYFVLSTELMDLLEASAPARIVSTSSRAHAQGDMGFLDDLQTERYGTTGARAYGRSKLANIWFTVELARRLEGTGVTATCFHPGFVASSFARNNGFAAGLFMTLTRPFQRNVRKGAETGVWLATSPDVEGESGGYYCDKKRRKGTKDARDPEAPAKLWAESEKIVARLLGD